MKLPIEVTKQMQASSDVSLGYEAIVRDCARVATDIFDQGKAGAHQGEQANRTAAAILARYGQEPK